MAAAIAILVIRTMTILKGETQLRLTAMPGKHAPGLLFSLLPPVMGSMLEFLAPADQLRLRLYISGDTLMQPRLKEIPRRYPEIDLALLHLGGTRLLGVLVTMDDRQGMEVLKLIAPRLAIPIHYEDYPVFKSPLGAFMKAVAAAGLSHQVQYLYSGERYPFEATESR